MSKKQTRRTFTKEFKLDVINQSDRCDKITELATDLGLRRELIYRWRAEFKADPQQSFSGNGVEKQTPAEEKIATLERQLADMRIQRDILKKGHGHLHQPPQVIYQFMDDHKDEFSIVKMSEVLEVSRSGYYRWRGRGPSRRALENKALTTKITHIWQDSAKTYGSPRIHAALLAGGEQLSRPRVARLMKKAGIASQIRPKWVTTTDSGHGLPVAPNLLDRDFQANNLTQAWVSDITYLPSSEGWLYLTTIMDLADRQIVGWSLAKSMTAEATTIAAWSQACTRRRPDQDLLFHSDRGVQYAAAGFTDELAIYKVTQSMSRKGNCWDNAPAETSGCSYQQVRRALFKYINIWYNRKRLHSSLDYQTPAQREHLLTQQPKAA